MRRLAHPECRRFVQRRKRHCLPAPLPCPRRPGREPPQSMTISMILSISHHRSNQPPRCRSLSFRRQPFLRRLLRCLLWKLPARNGPICSTRTANPTAPLPRQPKSNPKLRPSPRRLLPHLPPPRLRAYLRRAKAASTHRRTRARIPFCRCPQRHLPLRRHPPKTHHLQRRHSVRLPHQRRRRLPPRLHLAPASFPFPKPNRLHPNLHRPRCQAPHRQ